MEGQIKKTWIEKCEEYILDKANIIAFGLIGAGIIIFIYYIIALLINGFWRWGKDINISETGEFGDFVGGFIGTIISAAGFLFLYLTLKDQREGSNNQRKSFEKERFESNFFELLKLHRDNVAALKYKKQVFETIETFEDREVLKILFDEFKECLQDVRRFSNSNDPNDYILPAYRGNLEILIQKINPRINIIEFATIDIAYFLFFNGVDEEGASISRTNLRYRYNNLYYHQLIKYLQLKPKRQNVIEYNYWEQLQNLSHVRRRIIVDELYHNRRNLNDINLSNDSKLISKNLSKEKYYGGHHFRLGHYFRHLFQCYKFLNSQSQLKDSERYFYGKTLRAQLSTYEQALILINSLSNLGFKWEYIPEIISKVGKSEDQIEDEFKRSKMITYYNLIKNLPGRQLFGISYRLYYPKVKYEVD